MKEIREVMQEFYQRLKMLEPKIKFCFITGITKFSQLSSHTPTRSHGWTFSTINNLTNVTLDPAFSTICGITEAELTSVMVDDIKMLADSYGEIPEQIRQRLKLQYDGYHFSRGKTEVYNPYSLLKAFKHKDIANYWFESGTLTFLIRQMQHFHSDITAMDNMMVPSSAFDKPTEAMTTALPLLYQSGYLTIKEYDRDSQMFTLSIPNQEVRVGYTEGLLPAYVGLEGEDVQSGPAAD